MNQNPKELQNLKIVFGTCDVSKIKKLQSLGFKSDKKHKNFFKENYDILKQSSRA